MKKIVSLMFALIMAMTAVGCGGGGNVPKAKVGAPDYSSANGEIVLDCWIPPRASDAAFKEYADCGYNMMHVGNTSFSFGDASAKEDMERHFSLAEKYGIKIMLMLNALNMNQTLATSFEYVDKCLGSVFDKWKDSDTFYGYMPYDEPVFGKALEAGDPNKSQYAYDNNVDYILNEYVYFSQKYPGKAFETVLLGGGGTNNMYGPIFGNDYKGYVNYYCEKVLKYMPYDERIVSFDSYPFSVDRDGNLVAREGFVYALEQGGKSAEAYGADKWTYMQNHCYVNNPASVLYQYYTAMCYGFTHFITFTYREEWGFNQYSVDASGRKTENWYYYKNAHDEIKSFENVYLQFTDNWIGAMAIEGSERVVRNSTFIKCEEMLDSYERIKSLAATEDTVVGIMKDKNGYEGFMVASQAMTDENTRDKVEITFNGATHALVYTNGEEGKTVALDGGKISLDLKAGGGAFVIPYSEA